MPPLRRKPWRPACRSGAAHRRQYTEVEVETPDIADAENERHILPADPDVKNFSYTVVDGEVYYRENSVMTQVELSDTAKGRVTGMVELRQIVNELIDQQLNDYPDADIQATGIPVRQQFMIKHDKQKCREFFGWDETERVCLLMGGGEGLLPMAEIITHCSAPL